MWSKTKEINDFRQEGIVMLSYLGVLPAIKLLSKKSCLFKLAS